ncbi:MAG TPA: S8 family serine peptidase, partial [Longimicrobium sp.]|nr:S8 family serine peptidase [Longimicrobium sp.]
ALAAALLLSAACRDTTGGVLPTPEGPAAPAAPRDYVVATLQCSATAASLACTELGRTNARGVILGSNKVKLRSFNVVYDSVAEIFSADVTVQNLMTVPIGTVDGTTPAFIKPFFHRGPTVGTYRAPGDTGTVYVQNPDGYCNCSAANQPYFNYTQILQPNQESPAKNWKWHVPRVVNNFTFTMYVFARYQGEAEVPPLAPDSVPESVYDTTKLVFNDSVFGGALQRNLVLIHFKPTATAEDRLVGVNRTNGTVVGGHGGGGRDGVYVVRMPDDGTTTPLRTAIARLDSLPQVASASPEYMTLVEGGEDVVRPEEQNADWHASDWILNPDSAAGANWGLEAIQAPMAWSCTTGDSAVKVGIVDNGFRVHADITNVSNTGWLRTTATNHGELMASVIGADGNNSNGISGVMWKVRMHYQVVQKPNVVRRWMGIDEQEAALQDAIYSGARVINMSRHFPFYNAQGQARAAVPADLPVAQRAGYELAAAIDEAVNWSGNDPLIVLTAGNNGIDAELNGFPNARTRLPNRVIVVGAVDVKVYKQGDQGGSFTRGIFPLGGSSNYGPLVDIGAPGVNVGVLSNQLAPVVRSGTSVAAPYVTGTAGLMLALDPTLTAAELKSLLLAGAAASGRRYDNGPSGPTRYVLNAYESLKKVAERPGAGICGNPVWQDPDGTVQVRRGANWSGPTEALFTAAGKTMFSPQHATMFARFSDFTGMYWRNGQWIAGSTGAAMDNATNLSKVAFSHGSDTTITVTKRSGANPNYDELYDIKLNGSLILTLAGPRISNTGSISRCVMWDTSGTEWTDCYASWPTYSKRVTSAFSVSYSDALKQVALSVARDSAASAIEQSFYYYGGYYQRNYSYDKVTFDTWTYFIPLANPAQYDSMRTVGKAMNNLGYGEEGRRVVMRTVLRSQHDGYTPLQDTHLNLVACNASWGTLQGTAYTEVFANTGRSTSNCYPDATLAH